MQGMNVLPAQNTEREREQIRNEANVVGAWLARAGVLAILIGAGFAFKYGIDRGVIGPVARVMIGLAAGAGFVAWGEVARRKTWDLFAQALTAGGLALAYLSVLAAAQLYDLISGPGAFAALVSITVAGGLLALRHDSAALACFAIIGAFLNPFLVSTQHDPNPVATFYYLVAVNLVVVAGAFRRWRALSVLAFAGTVIVFGVAQETASPSQAGLFATVLFGIFTAYPFITRNPSRPEDITVAVLAAFAYIPFVEHQMAILHPERQGFITFAVAAIYAALAAGAGQLRREDPVIRRAFFALAAGAAVAGVPMQLQGPSLPAVWAAQGAVLIAIGWKAKYDEGLFGGAVLLQIATVMSFARLGDYHPDKLFVSGEGAAFLAVIASLFATAFVLRGSGERGHREAALIPAWAATILSLTWLSSEAVEYARRTAEVATREQTIQFALSVVWACFGAIALLLGVRAQMRGARYFGAGLLGIVVVKLLVNDVWLLTTGHRMIAFTGIGVLLIGCSFAYQKLRDLIVETPEEEEPIGA